VLWAHVSLGFQDNNVNLLKSSYTRAICSALPQNTEIRMRIPADPIIATTAGRREFRIPCKSFIFLYKIERK
jgi:hypothetical protein